LRETRNLAAEQTIEKLPFKCSFEECNVELLKTEIDAHEKDCNFRLSLNVHASIKDWTSIEQLL